MSNNGMIATEDGTSLTVLGAYAGRGMSGRGSVRLESNVQPGSPTASPLAMAFGGDVTLGPVSTLTIDVGGSGAGQFDRLIVDGAMQLGGFLTLSATAPIAAPATLSIVSAGELLGQFDAIPEHGSSIGQGVRFNGLTYDYLRDEVLVSLLPPLTGDFTHDGVVDGADLLMWQSQFGDWDPAAQLAADGNHDGAVDQADLLMLTEAMGAVAAAPAQSAAGAAAPEPATALLAVIGCAGLAKQMTSRRPCRGVNLRAHAPVPQPV